jgi:hypothetical protein
MEDIGILPGTFWISFGLRVQICRILLAGVLDGLRSECGLLGVDQEHGVMVIGVLGYRTDRYYSCRNIHPRVGRSTESDTESWDITDGSTSVEMDL